MTPMNRAFVIRVKPYIVTYLFHELFLYALPVLYLRKVPKNTTVEHLAGIQEWKRGSPPLTRSSEHSRSWKG